MNYKYIDEKKEHLHTLNGKPLIGTSTAVGIISKPLTWWASGMAVAKFGWLDPKKNDPESVKNALQEAYQRVMTYSLEDYGKLVTEAYKAHASNLKKAAGDGTDMHAELEEYVKDCIIANKVLAHKTTGTEHPAVSLFVDWSLKNVKKFTFSEGYCYSESLWVGGIADAGAILKDNKVAIFDFKSSKEAYFGQYVQAAGYAAQIEENGLFDKDGNQIKEKFTTDVLYIVPFGGDGIPKPRYDVADMKNNFKSAVQLYKAQNNFGN